MSDNSTGDEIAAETVFELIVSDVDPLAVELSTETAIDFAGRLPGLSIGIERAIVAAGLEIGFREGTVVVEPHFWFTPPQGARAALELAAITGGGYLRRSSNGEWAGALAASLGPLDATGLFIIGQIGGSTSFIAVLGARFTPGLPLGFGFEITGLGGLVGVNRRADTDLIRYRLAGGGAGNVLFCDDPIRNAPTVLGDLDSFFPAADGQIVVGPTFQLSWISPIVRADVAVIMQLPGPSKVAILGTLRVLIGANESLALLFMRMDFIGEVDLERKLISFDAQLVNSHAMGVFRLTGGIAMRIDLGNNPYVLLTIGGFHPRFDPGPLNLPAIPRVGAALNAPVGLFVRLEMYTAFTPNTLQAGALVQAGMRLGPLSAEGHFRFDALITFKPFTFDIEFSAGFAIRVFGETFGSITVSGRITGPGPLVIHAQASVKVLLVRVRGSATFELGARNGDSVVTVASVIDELADEITRRENLHSDGADPSIQLRTDIPRPDASNVVSPVGPLVWTQKRVPLDTDIDKFEGAPLIGDGHRVSATSSIDNVAEQEWFSPGSFTAGLDASRSLNSATFERHSAGMRFTTATPSSSTDRTPAGLELTLVKITGTSALITEFLPPHTVVGPIGYAITGLAEALSERDTTPPVHPRSPAVAVSDETFTVLANDGTTPHTGVTGFQALQYSLYLPDAAALAAADATVDL